jgi:hypothetical protein
MGDPVPNKSPLIFRCYPEDNSGVIPDQLFLQFNNFVYSSYVPSGDYVLIWYDSFLTYIRIIIR